MTDEARSIGSRVATGAFWSIGMRMSIRFLGIVSVIILARILVPEDFGIVAKASMIAWVLEMILEFGLDAALIRNQQATRAHYDTVWTIHVIRGTVIGVLLVAMAEPAASFLREPVLRSVLLFYALSSFINGLHNVGIVDFRKNLEFGRDFYFGVCRKLTSFVVTIVVAYIWETYWAFVAGVLAGSFSGLIASFVMSPYRPRLRLDEWRSLFHFSKWLFTNSLIMSASLKLDTVILSRFSSTEIVGHYTVADEVAGAASTELAMPIARATMPGLSKLNDDTDRYKSMYTQSILIVMLITVPAAVGISALAEPFVSIILGPKWEAASVLVKILALFGITRSVSALSASAFLSSGQVRAFAGLSLLHLFLRIVALGAGFMVGGVTGLAWGVLAAAFIQMLASLFTQSWLNFIELLTLARGLWRIIAATLVMYFCLLQVFPGLYSTDSFSELTDLLVRVISGATVYGAVVAALWVLSSRPDGPEKAVFTFAKDKLRPSKPIGGVD